MRLKVHSHIAFLAPANEVWGKVIFSQMFVCPQGRGGWLPSMHHRSHNQEGSAFGGSVSRGADPPPRSMGYGQQVGGTHPTGMHSCSECDCIFKSNY